MRVILSMARSVHSNSGMGTIKRHPVLTKETVRADGARQLDLRVYCDERGQSVPVDVCRACPVCISIDAEPSADRCVYCKPANVAARTDTAPAGAVLSRGVVVVDGDLLVRDAVTLFVERRVAMLVVADSDGRAQGVIHESRLLREIQDVAHARTGAIKLGWSTTALEPISTIASAPVSVPETFPLREAVLQMATAHQRQVLVVDERGFPIGLLRDVDALHGLRANIEE